MPGRGVLTLGDNLPGLGGLTRRRGYEPVVNSAWDKDRPPFRSSSSSSYSSSHLLPSPTPCSGFGSQPPHPHPAPAVGLTCHPRPRVFTLHFSLIAHFCKLVSISMLHLLPFNIFARPCRKKTDVQQKASPLTTLEGKNPGNPGCASTRGRGQGAEGACSRFRK